LTELDIWSFKIPPSTSFETSSSSLIGCGNVTLHIIKEAGVLDMPNADTL
jgi:hypothetical protein